MYVDSFKLIHYSSSYLAVRIPSSTLSLPSIGASLQFVMSNPKMFAISG